jgi:uncharacterized protein
MTFEELADCLHVEGFQETPSELHGLLSGRIAGGERLSPDSIGAALIEAMAIEEELVDNARDNLVKLYASILAAFEDDNFVFQPFLPGDDEPLPDRIGALSEWCECFLSGLGEASAQSAIQYSQDAVATIQDLAVIAQVGYDEEVAEEDEDENDFVELVEYVRMAAMMLYTEGNFSAETPPSGTIH